MRRVYIIQLSATYT